MMLEVLRGLVKDDLMLCLISGGSSALCCALNQITLEEKIALSKASLRSGASITEINTVSKHLSGINSGCPPRTARATRRAQSSR